MSFDIDDKTLDGLLQSNVTDPKDKTKAPKRGTDPKAAGGGGGEVARLTAQVHKLSSQLGQMQKALNEAKREPAASAAPLTAERLRAALDNEDEGGADFRRMILEVMVPVVAPIFQAVQELATDYQGRTQFADAVSDITDPAELGRVGNTARLLLDKVPDLDPKEAIRVARDARSSKLLPGLLDGSLVVSAPELTQAFPASSPAGSSTLSDLLTEETQDTGSDDGEDAEIADLIRRAAQNDDPVGDRARASVVPDAVSGDILNAAVGQSPLDKALQDAMREVSDSRR